MNQDAPQENSIGRIVQSSLNRLEAQVQEDPIGSVFFGLTFGAGLASLNREALRLGGVWLLKLAASEMINDARLAVQENE